METKTQVPSFTVSLRGYDREEVDHYLDSLAEALAHVEDAEERNRKLQSQVSRLNSRVKDLEERIQSDTPRTGALLGERISILLRSAEETAAETIGRAEAVAQETIAAADARLVEARAEVDAAVGRGREEAGRIEAAAQTEAAEILAESEARAAARTRQIEEWAEQVVSRTRAEEARMIKDQQERRAEAESEMDRLLAERDAVAATLSELCASLGRALALAGHSDEAEGLAGRGPEAATARVAASTSSRQEAEAGEPAPNPESASVPGSAQDPADIDKAVATPVAGDGGHILDSAFEAVAPGLLNGGHPDATGSLSAAGDDSTGQGDPEVAFRFQDDAGSPALTASDLDRPADDRPGGNHPTTGAVTGGWHPAVVFEGDVPELEGIWTDGPGRDSNEKPAPWPATVAAGTPEEAAHEAVTGEIEVVGSEVAAPEVAGGEGDQAAIADMAGFHYPGDTEGDFDAKLEAWVSEGARHFRKG